MNTKWQLFVTGCWRHSTHRWLLWKGAFIHTTQQWQHHSTMAATTHATTTYQTTWWWCIHQCCWWWPKLHGSKVGLDYHMHKWCTSCLGQTTIPRHEFNLGGVPVKNGNASSTYYHRVDVCRTGRNWSTTITWLNSPRSVYCSRSYTAGDVFCTAEFSSSRHGDQQICNLYATHTSISVFACTYYRYSHVLWFSLCKHSCVHPSLRSASTRPSFYDINRLCNHPLPESLHLLCVI